MENFLDVLVWLVAVGFFVSPLVWLVWHVFRSEENDREA